MDSQCLICNQNESSLQDVFKTTSAHSNTPLFEFIERFTKLNLKEFDNTNVCGKCIDELNNFDLSELSCKRIQEYVLQMFNETLKNNQGVKVEVWDDIDDPQDCDYTEKASDAGKVKKKRGRKAKGDIIEKKKDKVKKEKSSEVVVHECETCSKQFKTKGQLTSHVISHTGARPFVCDMCGKAYRHKMDLLVHIGLHSGHSPFKCLTCGKQFTQKGTLERHKNIHLGIPKHQCEQCGKQFIHRTSFQMHILTHSNVRDFTCSTCGLALRSSSHLNRHKKTHSKERKYPCAICAKSFVERYNLLAHMRTHNDVQDKNDGKHSCPICPLNFQRRKKLEDHLKNAHNTISSQSIATVATGVDVADAMEVINNSTLDCSELCTVKLEC